MESLLLQYENIAPLTAERGNMRIFAPTAYSAVRQAQMVPIVHVEALALASWFPICWLAGAPRPLLVVLRSLHKDGSCQPNGSPFSVPSLPLALRAYPFAVGVKETNAQSETLIDEVIADKPADTGAPILTVDGRAGRGTQMRLRAVSAFNQALAATESMTDELQRSGLLEPWRWEVSGAADTLADILIVRPSAFDTPRIFRFVRKFGAAGASFLGAHRLSLYRASALLQAANRAVAPAKEM